MSFQQEPPAAREYNEDLALRDDLLDLERAIRERWDRLAEMAPAECWPSIDEEAWDRR